MNKLLKNIGLVFGFILCITTTSCRSKGPYNPYLNMKVKPNQQQINVDKKVIKGGNKAYKKQLGDSRKHLLGRRTAPIK